MTFSQVIALKAKLHKDGVLEIKLHGRCMEPFLREGDMARILPVESIAIGDICLVELECKEVALHRAVGFKNDAIITKGDYSGMAEEISPDHILGCARAFKFSGSNGWVNYLPRIAQKSFSAWLSRGVSCRDEMLCRRNVAAICRKMKWAEGLFSRRYFMHVAKRGTGGE